MLYVDSTWTSNFKLKLSLAQLTNREIKNHSLKWWTIYSDTWKSTKNWDTFCNKLLEIKSKQVVNNRVINSALIESLLSGENLTSIAHFNGKNEQF